MTHGTATIGTGTHGHTVLGDIMDGTTHGTMDTADGTTHGIMDMPDGTATCIHITADGTEDGIHIGDIITTTTILVDQSSTETNGMAAATRAVRTESSQVEYRPVEAHQPAESAEMSPAQAQAEWRPALQSQEEEQQRQGYQPQPPGPLL